MQESLVIRPIRPGDNAPLATIIRQSLAEFGANKPGTVYDDPTTDDLFALFRQPFSAYWVAEVEGGIAGGAGIYPTPGLPAGYCELVKLYLGPAARGKGLGRTLIEHCLSTARDNGFSSVYLETLPELHQAVKLYRKCGFYSLPGPLGQSGHFGCNLWMVKPLE